MRLHPNQVNLKCSEQLWGEARISFLLASAAAIAATTIVASVAACMVPSSIVVAMTR